MADDTKTEDEEQDVEEKPKKSKKGLLLGGGILGLIGGAYLLATMAVPETPKHIPFKGPFSIDLQQGENLQVNLASDGGTRFLVMTLRAEVHAYDEAYATARVADPLYTAILQDALIGVSRTKTRDDLEDTVGAEVFRRQLLEAIRPILFPIHVGDPVNPYATHMESGLRSGDSQALGTYRRGFEDGLLHVDAQAKTVQLDDGAPVSFTGAETDLQVADANGMYVFLNVTQLNPAFAGDVQIGTFGRVSKLFFGKFIIQ